MECIARLVCEVGAVREPPLHALHLISLAGSHPTFSEARRALKLLALFTQSVVTFG